MKKLFILLLLLAPFFPAWADVSPRPEMDFSFIYNTDYKPLVSPALSEQIQCADNQCLESKPLGHYGLQKLYCSPGNCFSVAYEFADYQKLILAFEDGTRRESNIFPSAHKLRAHYNVHINANDLTVELTDTVPGLSEWARKDALFSLVLILLLELAAAVAYLIYTQKSFTILYSVAVANVITTFLSWMLLSRYMADGALLWVFCVLAETLILRLMNLKKLKLQNAFALSVAMNVTSYSLGMILSFWLAGLVF